VTEILLTNNLQISLALWQAGYRHTVTLRFANIVARPSKTSMTYKFDPIFVCYFLILCFLRCFSEKHGLRHIQIGAFLPILLDANIITHKLTLVKTFFQKI